MGYAIDDRGKRMMQLPDLNTFTRFFLDLFKEDVDSMAIDMACILSLDDERLVCALEDFRPSLMDKVPGRDKDLHKVCDLGDVWLDLVAFDLAIQHGPNDSMLKKVGITINTPVLAILKKLRDALLKHYSVKDGQGSDLSAHRQDIILHNVLKAFKWQTMEIYDEHNGRHLSTGCPVHLSQDTILNFKREIGVNYVIYLDITRANEYNTQANSVYTAKNLLHIPYAAVSMVFEDFAPEGGFELKSDDFEDSDAEDEARFEISRVEFEASLSLKMGHEA